MAKRYGGIHSPGTAKVSGTGHASAVSTKTARRMPVARPNLLFATAVPLALTAFGADSVDMVVNLAAFGVLCLAFHLLKEGLKAEAAFNARKVAHRPSIPRKLFAQILTALGAGLAAFDGDIPTAILYGTIAGVLCFIAFGADPWTSKNAPGTDGLAADRVARAVEEAEDHLGAIEAALRTTKDGDLLRGFDRFRGTARLLFRRVEEDPRDLRAARKYLGVYLLGARDATQKFVAIYNKNRDEAARARYEALLMDLETTFAARSEKLLDDDRADMNIEIDVLRERLGREGVTTD